MRDGRFSSSRDSAQLQIVVWGIVRAFVGLHVFAIMASLRTCSFPLRLFAFAACVASAAACRKTIEHTTPAPLPAATTSAAEPIRPSATESKPAQPTSPHKTEKTNHGEIGADKTPVPLQRCFAEDTALSPPRSVTALLNRSADRLEQAGQQQRLCRDKDPQVESARFFREALACAEESLRQNEQSVEAHHNRALALIGLGQKDEARQAITHALALDPDDPATLAGAAELYIHHLSASTDNTLIGLAYVRHAKTLLRRGKRAETPLKRPAHSLVGVVPKPQNPRTPSPMGRPERLAKPAPPTGADRSLLSRLLLLEGQALSDLGRASQALLPLDQAIALSDSDQARYERGLVLFDLCRLKEAQRAFVELTRRTPDDAWAHHQLGLVLEMLGEAGPAEQELASARKLAPKDFPPLLPISTADFGTLVADEVKALPGPMKTDLQLVQLELAELPDITDLTADQPTLSPTIVGLFRGLPLGMPDSEPRSIVLYRKNLLRIVATRDELKAQVRTTLLHELGHLRGEDDDELRARGLE